MTKLFDKINDILDEAKMKIQKLIETDGVDRDQEWQDKIEAKIKELNPNKPPDDDTVFFEWRATIGILKELLEEK